MPLINIEVVPTFTWWKGDIMFTYKVDNDLLDFYTRASTSKRLTLIQPYDD